MGVSVAEGLAGLGYLAASKTQRQKYLRIRPTPPTEPPCVSMRTFANNYDAVFSSTWTGTPDSGVRRSHDIRTKTSFHQNISSESTLMACRSIVKGEG